MLFIDLSMPGLFHVTSEKQINTHEMAHAVKLEDRVRPLFRAKTWQERYYYAEQHMQNPHRGHFFRDYAFTNYHEFFAVAVENFFERPAEF